MASGIGRAATLLHLSSFLSPGVGDGVDGWRIFSGDEGVQDPVLTVVKMKALSTCAMVLLAVSAFDVYVWSDDDDVAYQSWLPKKPGLTGKAVSGEMVTDGREGILGDLGLKSAKLRLKVWAVGLLSLQLGYFRACLKTISESMSVAKALMVEEEDHGDTYFA